MLSKLTGWDDTIVALATPPGIGAIGVIRLSGNEAFNIINTFFPSKDLLQQASHTLHVGFIKNADKVVDEVVVSLFRGPKSYTGEDVIEISCHGSAFIQQQVIDLCIAKGARLAKAGEFTQRAFLKGKMDLTQAEAVADLIASNTTASQKAALHNIRGGFSHTLQTLREDLIQFTALLELELDFSEEDVEFADRTKFYALIESAIGTTGALADSFRLGNVIRNGVSVAIIGRPNAGKSTLLNTLLNENRAIVSEVAGTTRDTIEEVLNIDGILFRLIDTAGIRDNSDDLVENIGIAKSREKMKAADIVLFIFDVATMPLQELTEQVAEIKAVNENCLVVANKIDSLTDAYKRSELHAMTDIIFISAKESVGVDEVKKALYDHTVNKEAATENTIVTNARHYQSLKQVLSSLQDIKAALDAKVTTDLLSPDIRRCLQYISEITGDLTNEDVLDHIFSKFCIGK